MNSQILSDNIQPLCNDIKSLIDHYTNPIQNLSPFYHMGSIYYESMLRYWSESQKIYVLSTQMNTGNIHLAMELNHATLMASIAMLETMEAWDNLIHSLTGELSLNVSELVLKGQLAITFLFEDGFMITGGLQAGINNDIINLGGVPENTKIIINDMIYIVNKDSINELAIVIPSATRLGGNVSFNKTLSIA